MHAKGTPLETPQAPVRARRWRRLRAGQSPSRHRSLPATLAVIALALGIATVGIGTSRDALALIGLAATGLMATALAATASKWMRCRDDLRAVNKELRRKNVELETRQQSIERALELVDERTQGRLRELVEASGDELAELVDEALEESAEGVS